MKHKKHWIAQERTLIHKADWKSSGFVQQVMMVIVIQALAQT